MAFVSFVVLYVNKLHIYIFKIFYFHCIHHLTIFSYIEETQCIVNKGYEYNGMLAMINGSKTKWQNKLHNVITMINHNNIDWIITMTYLLWYNNNHVLRLKVRLQWLNHKQSIGNFVKWWLCFQYIQNIFYEFWCVLSIKTILGG